MMKWHTL